MEQKKIDMLASVIEALEEIQYYKPLYLAVLKNTGDRKQALDAVKYVRELDKASGVGPDVNDFRRKAC